MILDLGCGEAKIAGAVGMDNVSLPGVDIVHDLLDFPYPFEDHMAQKIYLSHVIEHFELVDIQKILQECHRLLCNNGILYIRVPHVFSVAAWVDITHRTSFTFNSAQFWDAKGLKAYYQETENRWAICSTSASVTWFNWKRYRLRQLDKLLSQFIATWLNWLLKQPNLPGSADLLVKSLPLYFVEIRWEFRKA